jgi:hypothetical protein
MKPETTNNPDSTVKHDEDVKFELEKEPASVPLEDSSTKAVGETIIPAKEDTMGNSDFPPLTESDKQPKLPAE